MLVISKNSIDYYQYEFQETPSFSVENNEIMLYMSEAVKFTEDVDFNRIFDLFIENSDFMLQLYYDIINHETVSLWVDEYNQEVSNKYDFELRINWFNSIFENEFVSYGTLSSYEKDEIEENKYGSINFITLYELKNKKISIDDTYVVRDENNNVILTKEKNFTLYEIFQAFLKEICYFQTPINRDHNRKLLDYAIEESNKPGAIFYTQEEVKDMLSKKLEEFKNKKNI